MSDASAPPLLQRLRESIARWEADGDIWFGWSLEDAKYVLAEVESLTQERDEWAAKAIDSELRNVSLKIRCGAAEADRDRLVAQLEEVKKTKDVET